MHGLELPCSHVGFFQVFSSPADYRRWVSDDWDSESVDCCHLVLARELAPQNPRYSVSVLGGGVPLRHCCRMTARFVAQTPWNLVIVAVVVVAVVVLVVEMY